MRKHPAAALLLSLPEDQRDKLAGWLLGGMPYHQARILVKKEFGVEVRSLSTFSSFWDEACVPYLLARRRQMLRAATARSGEALDDPGVFDEATIDALKQRAYELAESPESKASELRSVVLLLLKYQEQRMKSLRLELDREKYEFDAAQVCLDRHEELQAICEENPLDDRVRLQKIRLLLFGPPPNEKPLLESQNPESAAE
jgi:hypothetical protein